MDEITKNLSSPTWWISVVLVGLLINLASAYLKPAIDRLMSILSQRWLTKAHERRNAYENEISELSVNIEQQRQYEHKHLSLLLHALFGLGFAALLIAMKIAAIVFPVLSIANDLGVSSEKSTSILYTFISVVIFVSIKLLFYADVIQNKLVIARGIAKGSN